MRPPEKGRRRAHAGPTHSFQYTWAVTPASAIAIDLACTTVCALLLARFGRLSHSHPGTVYLFFHLFTFSSRLWALSAGAPTLYSPPFWDHRFEPVALDEIVRASLYADVALVVMTFTWMGVARSELSNSFSGKLARIELNPRILHPICAVSFVIGIIGLLAYAKVPGVGENALTSDPTSVSSWLTITQTWPGLALLAMMYRYGFKPWLLIPMTVYLMIMAYQGYSRFRVIIPVILMVQMYLEMRGRRWPRIGGVIAFVGLGLIFFPLKTIGRALQEGEPAERVVELAGEILQETLEGKAGDHMFLDEYASALTLVDRKDKLYWGEPFWALATLPVPRALWPGKPSTADYIADFSQPWRPMGQDGMILTFLGEAYANFGTVGILFVPVLLALFTARFHFRAGRAPYNSLARFTYILLSCNLLQVYRDGLVSIVVFTLVNMLPLMLIILLTRMSARNQEPSFPETSGAVPQS